MIDCFSSLFLPQENQCPLTKGLLVVGLSLLAFGGQAAEAQRLRVDVGGGWAFPTNNVALQSEDFEADIENSEGTVRQEVISVQQVVDLKSGRHFYVGVGFVRSIGDNFALGARLRAHTSELKSTVDCRFAGTCVSPSGTLRTASVEGRIILTSPDWIDPYLLVGLGVVRTSVDGLTLRDVRSERIGFNDLFPRKENISFPDVSITDAGGDVGIGASVPLISGLNLDGEFRVTGSLPGGKENTVTTLPVTLGLSYSFQ